MLANLFSLANLGETASLPIEKVKSTYLYSFPASRRARAFPVYNGYDGTLRHSLSEFHIHKDNREFLKTPSCYMPVSISWAQRV